MARVYNAVSIFVPEAMIPSDANKLAHDSWRFLLQWPTILEHYRGWNDIWRGKRQLGCHDTVENPAEGTYEDEWIDE